MINGKKIPFDFFIVADHTSVHSGEVNKVHPAKIGVFQLLG